MEQPNTILALPWPCWVDIQGSRWLLLWHNITLVESPQRRKCIFLKSIFLKMWRLCPRCADNIHILGAEIIQTCTHYPKNSSAGRPAKQFDNPHSTHRSSRIHCIILWTSLPVYFATTFDSTIVWARKHYVHASQHMIPAFEEPIINAKRDRVRAALL
jgi:hypothetical protein